MENRNSRQRWGFSLIEIIVVSVLLTVLALLLVYGYRNMRDRAHTTICQKNMREMYKGLVMAQVDHQGKVMPELPKSHYWHPVIDEYIGGMGTNISRYAVSSSVWLCPTDQGRLRRQYQELGYGEGHYSGYPMNSAIVEKGKDDNHKQGWTLARINDPSRKVYLIESLRISNGELLRGPKTLMIYTPYDYRHWMIQAHPSGNNVLFVDGRVEAVTPEHPLCSLTASTASSWWYPD